MSGVSANAWSRPVEPLFLAGAGLFVFDIIALFVRTPWASATFVATFIAFALCIIGAAVLGVVGGRRGHLEAAYGYSTMPRSAAKVDIVDSQTGVVVRSSDGPVLRTRAQVRAAMGSARAIADAGALPIGELPAVAVERATVDSSDVHKSIHVVGSDGSVAQALYRSREAATTFNPGANADRLRVTFDARGVTFVGSRSLVWARFPWSAVGRFHLGSADLPGDTGLNRSEAFAIPLPGGVAQVVPARKLLGVLDVPVRGTRVQQLIAEVERLRPS